MTEKKASITTLIALALMITPYMQVDCPPEVQDCIDCDEQKECIQCRDTFFLNITKKPFSCEACPDNCKRCNSGGCAECVDGSFKKELQKFKMKVFYCEECSDSCETCDEESDMCTSCPEYYGLKDDHTCVFKYTRLIVIGLVIVLILLMMMVFLIAKCVCLEKAPEKESYGSILTGDNDLMSDHYKTARNEIGMNRSVNGEKKVNKPHDDSVVSNVQLVEDGSYLNISNVSTDPIISTLLAPPTQNFTLASEQGDFDHRNKHYEKGIKRGRGATANLNKKRGDTFNSDL